MPRRPLGLSGDLGKPSRRLEWIMLVSRPPTCGRVTPRISERPPSVFRVQPLLTPILDCPTLFHQDAPVRAEASGPDSGCRPSRPATRAVELEMTDHLIVLDDIPFEIDEIALRQRLHIDADSDQAAELAGLLDQAKATARPKAMYRIGFITQKEDLGVEIEGIRFSSRVLRVNLDAVHRVFAYVATCGVEIDHWAHTLDDVLHAFWAEAIKEAALRDAIKAMNEHIDEHYRPGHTSVMNPGSLLDWPLREQRPLFALLEDPTSLIGVQLTSSYLMVPNKSVSGMRFATEADFASCQLCPRDICPNRRAPYDAGLYERRYRPSSDTTDAHV